MGELTTEEIRDLMLNGTIDDLVRISESTNSISALKSMPGMSKAIMKAKETVDNAEDSQKEKLSGTFKMFLSAHNFLQDEIPKTIDEARERFRRLEGHVDDALLPDNIRDAPVSTQPKIASLRIIKKGFERKKEEFKNRQKTVDAGDDDGDLEQKLIDDINNNSDNILSIINNINTAIEEKSQADAAAKGASGGKKSRKKRRKRSRSKGAKCGGTKRKRSSRRSSRRRRRTKKH